MPVEQAVNVDSLKRIEETYRAQLLQIPALLLIEAAIALKINVLDVSGTDKTIFMQRKGNLLKPYDFDQEIKQGGEIIKFSEMALTPELGYINLKDNILRYRHQERKRVLSNAGEPVDLNKNKHPLEFIICSSVMKTLGEDIIASMFFSERDTADESPMGVNDGFYTIMDNLISSGEISAAKRNLIAVDTSDVKTTYQNVLDWLRALPIKLKLAPAVWRLTGDMINKITDSYKLKTENHSDPSWPTVFAKLKEDAQMPFLNFATHVCLGKGDRMTISGESQDSSAKDLFDLGLDNFKGNQIQIRNIDEDPNIVQFYTQLGLGMRVRAIHPSVFVMNQGTNTSNFLSGDYQ